MTMLFPLDAHAIEIDGEKIEHTAIRAAAGSGKTYQLSNRFLQLLAGGVEPGSILASTFTRLAAGQIRDKILMRLANAALDSEKRKELARDLQTKRISQQAVVALLRTLADRLHVLQIRTLDSFFAAVVNAFALELQIPLGSQVIEEEQAAALRSEAIRMMLDEQDPQRLVDLLRLLTQGSTDRGVTGRIESVVNDLYEIGREAPAEAWECVPELPGRLAPPQLIQAIQRLENVACGSDQRFVKAHKKSCEAARAWKWNEFLKDGLPAKLARGETEFCKKPINDDLCNAYLPLIRHAIAELVQRVREQTLATRELLGLFTAHYEKVKAQHSALTFADLNHAMSRAEALGQLDEISFRLDAKLQHMLLDEFQDTSITQWRALQPMVQEIISVRPPEKSFFCVGDVKQSIYGWRSASPEIFDELPQLLRGADGSTAIVERELAKSYRSSQIVIDAVNAVFTDLKSNPALQEFPDAADAWLNGFRHHETAKDQLPGRVEVRICQAAGNDDNQKHVRWRQAAELAAELHRSNPAISIAILTRTNNAVARLMYELGPSRLAVSASGRGGGPLTDAPPVNVILDLLQLADHPDDTIAAFNIAMSPAGGVVGLTDFANPKLRHHVSREIRESLLEEGYGAKLSKWVAQFAGDCDGRELRRLARLVELADQHDQLGAGGGGGGGGMRTGDFIQIVERTKIADVQPAPIQVMTIHQAKGLEFDAVILAELDGALTGVGTPPVVFERETETGPITRICRYMNQEVLELVPDLQPLFERHRKRTVRESLSVLYVAMTRAIHGLYMFIDPPRIKKDGSASRDKLKTLGGVVQCALTEKPLTPGETVYAIGDADWLRKIPSKPFASTQSEESTTEIKLADRIADPFLRGVVHAPASQADSSIRFELSSMTDPARQRGLAIHAMFEHLEWLEDFDADEQTLVDLALQAGPRQNRTWAKQQVAAFRTMLKQPSILEQLSLGARDQSKVRLHREHPFVRVIDGRLQRGKIDRITIEVDAGGRPTAATIIDFKTDQVSKAECANCAEHYRTQMTTYQQAVASMLKLAPQQIALRLLFVEPGIVVDL